MSKVLQFPKQKAKIAVDHVSGKLTGSPLPSSSEAKTNHERMMRIKASLERINELMDELRKTTRKSEYVDD
jgi:hypothetical protein